MRRSFQSWSRESTSGNWTRRKAASSRSTQSISRGSWSLISSFAWARNLSIARGVLSWDGIVVPMMPPMRESSRPAPSRPDDSSSFNRVVNIFMICPVSRGGRESGYCTIFSMNERALAWDRPLPSGDRRISIRLCSS